MHYKSVNKQNERNNHISCIFFQMKNQLLLIKGFLHLSIVILEN